MWTVTEWGSSVHTCFLGVGGVVGGGGGAIIFAIGPGHAHRPRVHFDDFELAQAANCAVEKSIQKQQISCLLHWCRALMVSFLGLGLAALDDCGLKFIHMPTGSDAPEVLMWLRTHADLYSGFLLKRPSTQTWSI